MIGKFFLRMISLPFLLTSFHFLINCPTDADPRRIFSQCMRTEFDMENYKVIRSKCGQARHWRSCFCPRGITSTSAESCCYIRIAKICENAKVPRDLHRDQIQFHEREPHKVKYTLKHYRVVLGLNCKNWSEDEA